MASIKLLLHSLSCLLLLLLLMFFIGATFVCLFTVASFANVFFLHFLVLFIMAVCSAGDMYSWYFIVCVFGLLFLWLVC